MSKVKPKQGKNVEVEAVAAHFPFHKYFSNAPQPVFKGRSYEEDMDIAEGCYRHIKKIFTQLEVRRSQGQQLQVACKLVTWVKKKKKAKVILFIESSSLNLKLIFKYKLKLAINTYPFSLKPTYKLYQLSFQVLHILSCTSNCLPGPHINRLLSANSDYPQSWMCFWG